MDSIRKIFADPSESITVSFIGNNHGHLRHIGNSGFRFDSEFAILKPHIIRFFERGDKRIVEYEGVTRNAIAHP